MVGGAVLNADYAKKIGADWYCTDANADVKIARYLFEGARKCRRCKAPAPCIVWGRRFSAGRAARGIRPSPYPVRTKKRGLPPYGGRPDFFIIYPIRESIYDHHKYHANIVPPSRDRRV